MLYKLIVAVLVAQAGAFTAPVARVSASRVSQATMADTSWRRSYDGKGGVAPAPAAAAAPTGSMSVGQACKFMEMEPSVSFAEKKAFLLGKGVSEFVITEAACTATDTTLVL